MPKITLFNPEQSPTVYDAEGRVLGGAERVEVEVLNEVAEAAIDAGILVREEPKTKVTASTRGRDESVAKDAPPLSKKEAAADADATGASSRAKRD